MDFTDTPLEVKGMIFILRNLNYSYRGIETKLKELGFNITHTTAKNVMDTWELNKTFDN